MEENKQAGRITSITIENFKGIGAPVTIPLKEFTLLFGKNSVGKSTIIEALLLMNDWMQNLGPDLDTLTLGGDAVHLGGFKRFVHGHDLARKIRIRVDFKLGSETLPRCPQVIIDSYWHEGFMEEEEKEDDERDLDSVDVHNLVDVESCYFEIVVGQIPETGKVSFLECNVGVNNENVISREGVGILDNKWQINIHHPAVIRLKKINHMTRKLVSYHAETGRLSMFVPMLESDDDLFDYTTPVPRCLDKDIQVHSRLVENDDPVWKRHRIRPPSKVSIYDTRFISHFASQVLMGSMRRLNSLMSAQTFIGPLRTVPQKVTSELLKEKVNWADGSEGWATAISLGFVLDEDVATATVEEDSQKIKAAGDSLDPDVLRRAAKAHQLMEWLAKGIPLSRNYEAAIEKLDDRLQLINFEYGVCLKTHFNPTANGDLVKLATRLYEHPRSQQAKEALGVALEEKKQDAVYEMVFVDRETGVELRPPELGVGISQMVPILVGANLSSTSILSIQQPELHLHPALQCDLADCLLIYSNDLPKTYLLETHSEHIILRLLRRIRETSQDKHVGNKYFQLSNDRVSILYVSEASDGARVTPIRVDENGEFLDEWPEGFFEEGFDEILGGL